MNRQKGQSVVELALILPLFFTMCFGMIYGGMVFMDYLSLNNSAREVAREISLTADKTKQLELAADFDRKVKNSEKQVTTLYSATSVTAPKDAYVKVTIDLTLNEKSLLGLLAAINFPPKKLNSIEIVMPLENKFDKAEGQP